MAHEHYYTDDLNPPEFYAGMHNPNPREGPHPALRNVIFLIACHYHGGHLTALEPIFLQRAMKYLYDSMSHADRLLDFVEANTYLVIYYVLRGR